MKPAEDSDRNATRPTPSPSAPIHDCWNEVGVSGDGSCGELARVGHCRNCAVYGAAGRRLLDRPMPVGYREELGIRNSELGTRNSTLGVPRSALLTVVIFRLGREWYALPATAFQEVAENRRLHTLPRRKGGRSSASAGMSKLGERGGAGSAPHPLALGLVNVRGELLVCAAAGQLLDASQPERGTWNAERGTPDADRSLRLLVANWAGQRIVFPVDEISGTQRLAPDAIHAPPATNARATHTFTAGVFGWSGHTVGLLNPEAFFTAVNRNLA